MSSSTLATSNPATGFRLATYETFTLAKVEATLTATHAAQQKWAAKPIGERSAILTAIADQIRSRHQPLARLIVEEMGKPIGEALGELDKCAGAFEYYAKEGPTFLADEEVATNARRSWVAKEPMGVLLAVMPWNFPWWQVARFAAPALLAGNAAILKHSPNVTGTGLAIERLFADAGVPEDVFRTIVLAERDVPMVVGHLLADDRVAAVSLTGSERAGALVASVAGKEIKKSLLELGGSDPLIVLDDANLNAAVAAAIKSRFGNCGQSCLAAKRLIVQKSIASEFEARLVEKVSRLVVGDPTEPSTTIGPLARLDLVETLEKQVKESVAAGAKLLAGGHRFERPGAWYAPTVLSKVSLSMPVMTQETFGPVAAIMTVQDDEDAVAVANATRYGLGAAVWSRNTARALAIGRQISSGALFVNALAASDPRLPFGGTKRSGYGRELGAAGVLEFVNVRTYFVGAGAPPERPAME